MVRFRIVNDTVLIDLGDVELCHNYDISIKLERVAVILSILYDTYLPYGLYGPPLIPNIIISIT